MYDDYDYDPREPPEARQKHRRPPPPQAPPPHRPLGTGYEQKRVSSKCIAGMIITIVALIFIVILMFMGYPWYSITYEANPEGVSGGNIEFGFEYYLDEVSLESTMFNQTVKNTTSYDDDVIKDDSKEVKEVVDIINYFFIFSIILLIVSIVLIPVAAIGKIPHGIALVTLLIALIITLITPIYFFLYFPPAVETQINNMMGNQTAEIGFIYDGEFIGSRHGEFPAGDIQMNFEMEYGPGMTFWFSFVPMFIILGALIVYSGGKRDLQYMGPVRGSPGGRREPPPPPHRQRRDYDEPPRPPPRSRKRDYGPPRPMREEDYDSIPRSRPPPRRDGYDPRRESGYRRDEEYYRPPVIERDYDRGPPRGPPRPPRRRRDY